MSLKQESIANKDEGHSYIIFHPYNQPDLEVQPIKIKIQNNLLSNE
jgi:hypothetical protein